jgi:exodeoxyribonuclease V gamma subunit
MIIHRSNRTEELIAELSRVVERPMADPFARETLVVQGRGMERWLSMELADRLGIWANAEVLSLRGLLDAAFRRVLDSEVDAAFDPDSLMWSIADTLPTLVAEPGFEAIEGYLESDVAGRRHIQLSYQIANTFYQYMTYRPEMMVGWQNASRTHYADPDEQWQAALWRALIERLGSDHLAGRAGEFISKLSREEGAVVGLPSRVSIFGVSSLPRLYLDLFSALSRHLELHVFILSPSQEYWADTATPHEVRRALRETEGLDESSLYLSESHPLLASLGHLGRDFQLMLEDEGSYQENERDLYCDPLGETSSLLAALQSDILNARVRKGNFDSEDMPEVVLDVADHSVRVHSCHGPMREVEVLCEELVACFEADPTLEPQDVVVMTPNIASYAPYIEAVFGIRTRGDAAVADGEGAIPYRIADRWPLPSDEVVDAFDRGLDFLVGRFTATEGVDLLSIEGVHQHFGFEARELVTVREWIVESGVRWGVDAQHRASLGQPETSANTWEFGLERLLLGYAVPDDGQSLFCDVRPQEGVEGQRAAVLGRLLDFVEFCRARREKLTVLRSPSEWRSVLLEFLDGLVERTDNNLEQHLLVRRVLDDIAKQADAAGYEGVVSLESIREQVARGFEHAHAPSGFLTGGVTFCELVPMRSIPFRVVCLLGMSDDAFPRVRHSLGFDLVAKQPRVGDRTARDDDRYLFLEAILSARDRLVITYIGQSIKDGAVVPPSAVVSELLDVVAAAVTRDAEGNALSRDATRELLVIRHPLQPFDGSYFSKEQSQRFPVHASLYCDAARKLNDPKTREPVFLSEESLGSSAGQADEALPVCEIELEDLVSFFTRPASSFLRNRLQISVRDDYVEVANREPFDLDGLEQYQIGTELLDLCAAGVPAKEAHGLLRASGRLPHGVLGAVFFEQLHARASAIVAKVHQVAGDAALASDSFSLSLQVGATRAELSGELVGLGERGQVVSRFSKLGRPAELGAYLRHLVLNAVASEGSLVAASGMPLETFFIGRPKKAGDPSVARFAPVEDATEQLGVLVALYLQGQTTPLRLFPEASRAYAERFLKSESHDESLRAAKTKLEDGFSPGELSQPANALLFKGIDVLAGGAPDMRFADLATAVFVPLLHAREEVV